MSLPNRRPAPHEQDDEEEEEHEQEDDDYEQEPDEENQLASPVDGDQVDADGHPAAGARHEGEQQPAGGPIRDDDPRGALASAAAALNVHTRDVLRA